MTLVYLAIAFTCGILLGHVLRTEGILSCLAPPWLFPCMISLALAGLLCLRRRSSARLGLALVIFAILGAWRYQGDPFERCWTVNDLAYYQGSEATGVWATVDGMVVGYPDVRDQGSRYQLDAREVTIDGRAYAVQGRAMVEAARYPIFDYGDRLRIDGILRTPPVSEDFDYRRYLATRGIHSLIRRPRIERLAAGEGQYFWRALYKLRGSASRIVNQILPEPAASLAGGMVLGIEGGISKEVNDAFETTGTSHLIVISGSNIAFLSGALVGLLAGLMTRRHAVLLAAPIVLCYVLLVGADPPALRAGIMGLTGLGAVFFGRRNTAYVSLCAAALVMIAINPLSLWDIGFQLSFATSLGLVLFTRPIANWLMAISRRRLSDGAARRLVDALNATFVVTLAAQAAILPLVLYYFGRFSLVSLLTNILVLPVQPAILASSIAALLGGMLWQPLGQVVGVLPWALLNYTVAVVRATAGVPFAALQMRRVTPALVVGYYVLLGVAVAYPRIVRAYRTNIEYRRAGAWAALIVVPVCCLWFAWRSLPDGRLHVLFVPGGKDEATVVTTPGGRTAWFWNGGDDGGALMASALSGQLVRDRPDVVLTDCEANPWQEASCIDPAELVQGTIVRLEPGVTLERVEAGESWALILRYKEFLTLLPATLSQKVQAEVAAHASSYVTDEIGLSVLKSAGPGVGAWPSVQLLNALRPQLVLWPVETTYPPDVSGYLETRVATARIEAEAAVEVVSDGTRFWLVRHSPLAPR